MLDLSFELGIPAHLLAQTLPESEYQRYLAYAHARGLPSRRLEIMLAQLTALVSNAAYSDHKVTAQDFLLDPYEEDSNTDIDAAETEEALAELKAHFGFAPTNTINETH